MCSGEIKNEQVHMSYLFYFPTPTPTQIKNLIVKDKVKLSLKTTWKKTKTIEEEREINKTLSYNYWIWAWNVALDFLEIKAKMGDITVYSSLIKRKHVGSWREFIFFLEPNSRRNLSSLYKKNWTNG